MEEIPVGVAETVPCSMLLGIDWPYLKEVICQLLMKTNYGKERSPQASCFGDPEEDLDVDQIIGKGHFREEQCGEPLFWNI